MGEIFRKDLGGRVLLIFRLGSEGNGRISVFEPIWVC
jgi:hypothetical protein